MHLHQLPGSSISLHPDRWTGPFWEAAATGRLVVARCPDCDTYRMPPSPYCPSCRSQVIVWEEVPPTGTLYSYTVIHQALTPDYKDHVPYGVGVCALDAAPVRLIANTVDLDSSQLAVGLPVEIGWISVADGQFPIIRPRRHPD